MFTEYYSWFTAIQSTFNTTSSTQAPAHKVEMPLTINLLLKDKQGTKHIRQTFEKAKAQCNITGQAKWIMELNIPGNFNWSKIYTMATQCKLDARLRYFNFQVLHRTLTTNKALKLYNIAESNTCGNCPEIDTISHRLYNCNTIQP